MYIEVVAMIALVGIAYFAFARRKNATPAAASVFEAAPTVARAPELPPEERQIAKATEALRAGAVAPAPELPPEEHQIAKAREALKAGADVRTAVYNEHRASLADAQSKLRDAEKFAEESGLCVAGPWLWDHMQFWPSWKERPDQWTPPVALDDLTGASQKEVRWTWQGQTFGMLFEKWPSHGFSQDMLSFSTITVESDGVVVAAIIAKTDLSREYDTWHFSGIDTLKVGPWIAEFIRFYQEVRLADEVRGYARDTEYVTAKAARIDLG